MFRSKGVASAGFPHIGRPIRRNIQRELSSKIVAPPFANEIDVTAPHFRLPAAGRTQIGLGDRYGLLQLNYIHHAEQVHSTASPYFNGQNARTALYKQNQGETLGAKVRLPPNSGAGADIPGPLLWA